MKTLNALRWIGLLEGLSFLLLLFVAMPLKYWAGMPIFVRVMGMAHGVLFVAFVVALIQAAIDHGWPLLRSVLAFLSSLVPFGTFALDRSLRREMAALPSSAK